MRTTLLSLALSAVATAAIAQPVLPAGQIGCEEARAQVYANHIMIVQTGYGTYDRVVSSQNYCAPHETTEPKFTASADSDECFIGRKCVTRTEEMRPF